MAISMTMDVSSSSDTTIYVVLAIIVLVMIRRVYLMTRGAPVRPARLFAFAGFYVLLFAISLSVTASITPLFYLVIDGALVAVTAVFAAYYLRDHVHLERRPPDDQWFYRLSPVVSIAYVVLFLTRIGVSIWVLGPAAFDYAPGMTVTLSSTAALLLQLVDVLFSISTGILVGRSVGVYLAYERELSRPPAPLPTAPKSNP